MLVEILSGFAGIVTALAIARVMLLGWQIFVIRLQKGCEALHEEIVLEVRRTLAMP